MQEKGDRIELTKRLAADFVVTILENECNHFRWNLLDEPILVAGLKPLTDRVWHLSVQRVVWSYVDTSGVVANANQTFLPNFLGDRLNPLSKRRLISGKLCAEMKSSEANHR